MDVSGCTLTKSSIGVMHTHTFIRKSIDTYNTRTHVHTRTNGTAYSIATNLSWHYLFVSIKFSVCNCCVILLFRDFSEMCSWMVIKIFVKINKISMRLNNTCNAMKKRESKECYFNCRKGKWHTAIVYKVNVALCSQHPVFPVSHYVRKI